MKTYKDYHRTGSPDLPINMGRETPVKRLKLKPFARTHKGIEITLQVAGSSVNQIDDQIVTHYAGDIWIVPSGISHRRISYSDDSIIHWMIFLPEAITMRTGHFFQDAFTKPLSEGRLEMPTSIQPGHPCYEAVREAMMQIKNCPYGKKNYKEKRLLILMQICLALMPYCHVNEDIPVIQDTFPEPVRLCMIYISNRYPTEIKMADIAKYCHLHPNRLSAIFKAHTGQTVFEYLTKFRIETAANLLKREDLPVSKIAELVGFRSECIFYRKFKEIMGTTPKAYAKQQQEK